ncbi:unnamed protein product [Lactuca saligna]|uniref:SAM-dependent MTase DRM-type domain-containing protein n=1 Tax=Lactuca saligna TaxID=75948 RepID=A0AA35UVT1_LACSI|nr:unnamed protein product [Lactuca saligna]
MDSNPFNKLLSAAAYRVAYPESFGQMDDNSSSVRSDTIDWNTRDERRRSSSSSNYHFIKMGFPQAMVDKVIAEIGDHDIDAILDTLLSYYYLDETLHQEQELNDSFVKSESNFESDFSDLDDSCSDEDSNESFEKDDSLVSLIDMGYSNGEASAAIARCGKDMPLSELVDFISAAHISKQADAEFDALTYEEEVSKQPKDKKRKSQKRNFLMKKKTIEKKPKRKRNNEDEDEDVLHLPNPMIGFGVPHEPFHNIHRTLPDAAIGPLYFYYENVAFTPKGVWNTIKRFLYEIEPEFVDSKFLCAAARKRGYIHNLPLTNRSPIQPLPPRTIFEALPGTKKWWPSWDKREQLNCILTCIGSAQLTDRIRLALSNSNSNLKSECEPSEQVKKFVINECKKWNMVWTGKTKVAPLEPDEIELIMGYPIYHTRGASKAERYKV